MALKTYRPTTPTHRYQTTLTFDELTGTEPHRPLLFSKKRASGRNNHGHITVRHHGGGHKRYIRIVDFRRDKRSAPGIVESIEYDPGRTCFISLVVYPDGERRYILATANMKKGMKVVSGPECDPAEGNCIPLKNIPLGTMVHNVEMIPGKGGQIARGAGAYAEILAKENKMVQIKLPSGEVRNIPEHCYATIGQVSNAEHMNIVVGSAGRKRWMGWRPRVRAIAMNPVDHPMGGGEGRSKSGGGWQHPVSPWGQPAKGFKTRNHKKSSNQYIVRGRKG
jgi:large subunit ribosomal protein L2